MCVCIEKGREIDGKRQEKKEETVNYTDEWQYWIGIELRFGVWPSLTRENSATTTRTVYIECTYTH